jgi:hypothetical protein
MASRIKSILNGALVVWLLQGAGLWGGLSSLRVGAVVSAVPPASRRSVEPAIVKPQFCAILRAYGQPEGI